MNHIHNSIYLRFHLPQAGMTPGAFDEAVQNCDYTVSHPLISRTLIEEASYPNVLVKAFLECALDDEQVGDVGAELDYHFGQLHSQNAQLEEVKTTYWPLPDPEYSTAQLIESADLNTILAALRYYQESGMGEAGNRSDAIHDIATDNGNDTSLDNEGIDALCEALNSGDVVLASKQELIAIDELLSEKVIYADVLMEPSSATFGEEYESEVKRVQDASEALDTAVNRLRGIAGVTAANLDAVSNLDTQARGAHSGPSL